MNVTEIYVVPQLSRIRLTVEMPDPDRFLTSQVPHLPQMLFRLYPHLARHRCENGRGHTFRRECRATEIPHLFEHLIIELQGQAQPTERLRGETEWNWRVDPRGRFYVYVDYENELLAVAAIRLAEQIMHALDQRNLETLDVDAGMERLREVARMGRELTGGGSQEGGAPSENVRSWANVSFSAP